MMGKILGTYNSFYQLLMTVSPFQPQSSLLIGGVWVPGMAALNTSII